MAAREQKKIDKVTLGALENYKPGKIVRIRGTVLSKETRTPLVGATVISNGAHGGSTTDASGNFELKLPAGEHVLTVGFVSFTERIVDLTLYEGGEISMMLEEEPTLLQEVVVSSQPINELTTGRPGQLQLSVGAMKKQPSLLGEADLVRQLQTLPGVTVAGEAAADWVA